jgi:hypothetical protein
MFTFSPAVDISVQRDEHLIRHLKERILRAEEELSDLMTAIPSLDEALEENQQTLKIAESALRPLEEFNNHLALVSRRENGTLIHPESPNPSLRIHPRATILSAKVDYQCNIDHLREVVRESYQVCGRIQWARKTAEAMVETMSRTLDVLHIALRSLQSVLDDKAALGTPISQLPPEILAKILRTAVELEKEEIEDCLIRCVDFPRTKPRVFHNITRVCRLWREVLI